MTRRHWLGLVAIGLGVAFAVTGREGVPARISRYLVLFLGSVAVLVGIGYALRGQSDATARWQPDDTEAGIHVRVPGDEFEADTEQAFRAHLRGHVVDALVEAGYSRPEAKSRVADGTWTDDRYAAAYLGDESLRDSLAIRIAGLGSGSPITERTQRRTVAELRRLREDADR